MDKNQIDEQLSQIHAEMAGLKLDDSLLFLNHTLGVSRGFTTDPVLGQVIASAHLPILPHLVHFLAKQLLLRASNLGLHSLNWDRFRRLCEMCFVLDDPIQHDPNWKDADPSGFFERILAQQISAQRRNLIQKYGLALGLFRDVGIVVRPKPYDLRVEIEKELGTTIEQFMAMGHATFAIRAAKHQGNECIGSFTPMLLAEAYRQGLDFCVPEVWTPYLERVSCDQSVFRKIATEGHYAVKDNLFEQFGFNPLRRFPISNLGNGRFLAVDPELIVERVTLGLFYDLFERDAVRFSERFGYAFESFVGNLLASVWPQQRLWSAAVWEGMSIQNRRQSTKMCDWALVGDNCTFLFECKSLRPSLELTTYGSERSIIELTKRVASAVEQLSSHAHDMDAGKWESAGLFRANTVGVVVTYGHLFTVNGPFIRSKIRQLVSDRGLNPIPFVVLSLDELDSVLALAESGTALDSLLCLIALGQDSFDPLSEFREQLRKRCVSSFTFSKGKAFLDAVSHRR